MRAVLYVRVSTNEQAMEGYSISAQLSLLQEYAKHFNYNIIKIYQDAGISGKNISDRPAMCELIEDAKLKKFDIVLVWKLSRLSRSLLDLLKVVDIFNNNNISFLSYSEKFDTSTPIGKMLLQLLGSIAEFERNTIIENVKMGLNERFKQGHSKGSIPFGYIYDNKKAVIVPDQAEFISQVYQRIIESDSVNYIEIANEFNAKGYRTRSGDIWNRTTIKDLISNCFYAGYVKTGYSSHGKKLHDQAAIIKGQHEPIVDEETFNRANSILINSKRIGNIRNWDSNASLSGLILCPICGGKLYSYGCNQTPYINAKGEKKIYEVYAYRCANKAIGLGKCKGIQISYKKIDPHVVDAIAYYVDSKKYIKYANEISISKPSQNNKIDIIEKELKQQKALKEKYFKAFESSELTDFTPFIDKINALHKKIQELENAREKLIIKEKYTSQTDFSTMINEISDFKTMYYALNNSSRKELMKKIIKTIILTTDKKILHIDLTNGDRILLS